MLRLTVLAAGFVLVVAVSTVAFACGTSVRDASFGMPRDVHRLCVIGDATDSSANADYESLATWLEGPGAGLNLELVRVNADDPEVNWEEHAIPSAPPSLPVVVLAGRNSAERRSFLIDHWEPGPNAADLESLRLSPVRDAVLRDVLSHVAVLLYVPGTGADSGSAESVLETAVKEWKRKQPPGVSVVRADRADERERLLLSFAGIRPDGPDWVGVVFGRMKLMAPPLEGEEITVERLNELIGQLTQECSCLRSPQSMGVDMLCPWNERISAKVETILTPDILAARTEAEFYGSSRRLLVVTVVVLAVLGCANVLAATLIVLRKRRRYIPPTLDGQKG